MRDVDGPIGALPANGDFAFVAGYMENMIRGVKFFVDGLRCVRANSPNRSARESPSLPMRFPSTSGGMWPACR